MRVLIQPESVWGSVRLSVDIAETIAILIPPHHPSKLVQIAHSFHPTLAQNIFETHAPFQDIRFRGNLVAT